MMLHENDNYQSVLEMELETLRSIYLSELDVKYHESDTSSISIQLYPATADKLEEQYVRMNLTFKLSEKYPEVLPEITIQNTRGISDEKIEEIIQNLLVIAETRIGSSMLFELIQTAKEQLTAENCPNEECAICLYGFLEKDVFMRTECYHYFHCHCLSRYLKHKSTIDEKTRTDETGSHDDSSENKIPCPVCRCGISFSDRDKDFPEPISMVEAPLMAYSQEWNHLKEYDHMYQKQLAQGGIIDLEAENHKFWLEISSVPERVVAPNKDTEMNVEKREEAAENSQPCTDSACSLEPKRNSPFKSRYRNGEISNAKTSNEGENKARFNRNSRFNDTKYKSRYPNADKYQSGRTFRKEFPSKDDHRALTNSDDANSIKNKDRNLSIDHENPNNSMPESYKPQYSGMKNNSFNRFDSRKTYDRSSANYTNHNRFTRSPRNPRVNAYNRIQNTDNHSPINEEIDAVGEEKETLPTQRDSKIHNGNTKTPADSFESEKQYRNYAKGRNNYYDNKVTGDSDNFEDKSQTINDVNNDKVYDKPYIKHRSQDPVHHSHRMPREHANNRTGGSETDSLTKYSPMSRVKNYAKEDTGNSFPRNKTHNYSNKDHSNSFQYNTDKEGEKRSNNFSKDRTGYRSNFSRDDRSYNGRYSNEGRRYEKNYDRPHGNRVPRMSGPNAYNRTRNTGSSPREESFSEHDPIFPVANIGEDGFIPPREKYDKNEHIDTFQANIYEESAADSHVMKNEKKSKNGYRAGKYVEDENPNDCVQTSHAESGDFGKGSEMLKNENREYYQPRDNSNYKTNYQRNFERGRFHNSDYRTRENSYQKTSHENFQTNYRPWNRNYDGVNKNFNAHSASSNNYRELKAERNESNKGSNAPMAYSNNRSRLANAEFDEANKRFSSSVKYANNRSRPVNSEYKESNQGFNSPKKYSNNRNRQLNAERNDSKKNSDAPSSYSTVQNRWADEEFKEPQKSVEFPATRSTNHSRQLKAELDESSEYRNASISCDKPPPGLERCAKNGLSEKHLLSEVEKLQQKVDSNLIHQLECNVQGVKAFTLLQESALSAPLGVLGKPVLTLPPGFANPSKKVIYGLPSFHQPPPGLNIS